MARLNARWRCIPGCGSCCRLDPELRQEALALLDAEQQSAYMAMVGEDGWCVHYDTGGQRCRIYATRPAFCHVDVILSRLGADGEAAEAGEPGEGPFDDPPVSSEATFVLYALAGDPRRDVAVDAGFATAGIIVSLVGVQLSGPMLRSARRPRMAGMASSKGSSMRLSCVLAPVSKTVSGRPCRSVTMWRSAPVRRDHRRAPPLLIRSLAAE